MTSLEQRLEQLEGRIESLEDREDIREALSRYAKALDERNLPEMSKLWSREAVLIVRPWGYEFQGYQAIVDFYEQYFKSDWIAPRHNGANESIERDGSGYKAFSYFFETLSRGEHSVVGWGTWVDRFVREDGVWKFSLREINVMVLAPIAKGWAAADKIMDL